MEGEGNVRADNNTNIPGKGGANQGLAAREMDHTAATGASLEPSRPTSN